MVVVCVVTCTVCRVTHQLLPKERIQSRCAFCSLPCYVQVTHGALPLSLEPGSRQHECGSKPTLVPVHLGPSSPLPCQIRSRILQPLLLLATWAFGTEWEGRIIESYNCLGWMVLLRSLSRTINLTLPNSPLNRVPKHHIYTSLKYLQEW